MASVNISLREEAYRYLLSLKTKEKSFSDVIIELKENCNGRGRKENVMKFFGVLKDEGINWKEKEGKMKNFRESFNKRLGKNDRAR